MTNQFAFPKSKRLLHNAQFQYAYRRGRSHPSQTMILIVAKARGKTRAGFSVGKKVGNSVYRSRAKRLLRESYRLLAYQIKNGLSLVFVARATIVGTPFAQVQTTMLQLLSKAGCIKDTVENENDAHRNA